MSKPRGPRLDQRRESDFRRQLLERAQQWIPAWGSADGESDFAQALLAIAARFQAEVAERLDKGADKMALGLLDWLAIRGQAAIPARMPVVFKLADNAAAVLAPAPVQLQVDALGTAVVFETEQAVQLVPSRIEMVVGTDSASDAYYLPPPGLSSLAPLEPLPTQWQLRSFAAPGATTLQLDPALGLVPDMLLEIAGFQFRVVAVNEDLVTIDPPVPGGDGFDTDVVRKVTSFDPFGASARNRQMHALYLGHADFLNIESEAVIKVGGVQGLGPEVRWHYWGMRSGSETADWQAFEPGSSADALRKPKGAIEERAIGELTSRWIRASIDLVMPGSYPLSADALTLSVNPIDLNADCDAASEAEGVGGVLALTNNTPLELNDIFFPLGREPRQFDAFYLGSEEAFSKHGARIRMCIDMADASFSCFAALRSGAGANRFLAGVAQDGHLHLLSFDPVTGRLGKYRNLQPLRPPSPAFGAIPGIGLPVTLDARPKFRPALWSKFSLYFARDVFVAVSAGASVWVWHEFVLAPSYSGWINLGMVVPEPTLEPVAGLAHLSAGAGGNLFALLGGALYVHDEIDPAGPWTKVTVTFSGAEVALAKVTPILEHGIDPGEGSMAAGLLAVGADKSVYVISLSAGVTGLEGTCTKLFGQALVQLAAAGVRRADHTLLVVAACELGANQHVLRAFLSGPGTLVEDDQDQVPLPGLFSGDAIDLNVTSGRLGFAVSMVGEDGKSGVAWWSPFSPSAAAQLVTSNVPEGLPNPAGSPTLLAQHIVVPAQSSQVLVAEFNLQQQQTFATTLKCAVVTALSDQPLEVNDSIAVMTELGARELRTVVAEGVNRSGETMYEMDAPFDAAQAEPGMLVYRGSTTGFVATMTTPKKISLAVDDVLTAVGDVLLIADGETVGLYTVAALTVARVATLNRPLGASVVVDDPVDYWRPIKAIGAVHPLMKLNPLTTGNWDAALLDRTMLTFPGAEPERQRGKAFSVDTGRRPILVTLEREFEFLPAAAFGTLFVVDGAVDKWTSQLGDSGTNPDLSWEYWNGSTWWKLPELHDETLNLKRSGAIRFDIPADMQATDWAGQTNQWIRARLVGGDYGQVRTVVRTVNNNDGSTSQTIERFPDEVRAPQVLRLRVQYAASGKSLPTYVVTADSGAVRDQSDANRTPGALVSIFTPLASAMPASAGMAGTAGAGSTPGGAAICQQDCACSNAHPASSDAQAPGREATTGSAAPTRALYLGFSSALAGQPVNLLALVEREQMFDAFAPLNIEALSGEYFIPVVAEDTTRALGESGLLSLSLTLPTVTAALFGRALCWLRLSPARDAADAAWTPHLRGVYINAAWARACETMTRERLGSSIGAPGQAFLLARPPLLRNTLELRVREPLSGEEREALLLADPASVVSDVAPDLRGHWVRWRQVTDVDDAGPSDRVYALDETTGEVRFGDGMHGAIPPIGRDAIVAFFYQRSEPGELAEVVPANSIAARTGLNLITPVEGVEAAYAADHSAGGAPPEDAARIQRFAPARLRHRERALTLEDFEQHALQSSPDIVQARAFRDAMGVRVVVAMRDAAVRPSQADRRALRNVLLAVASPQMARGQALRIDGPELLRLRVSVTLRVDSLDGSGHLANYAKRCLAAFFDPGVGGLERDGWPLGADPAEDDIALALLDAPGLLGIDAVKLEAVDADGLAGPWQQRVRRDVLVVLADDGVRIDFVIEETES